MNGDKIVFLSGLLAVFVLTPAGFGTAGVAAVGLGLLVAGTRHRHRTQVHAGGILVFVAILVAGIRAHDPGLLLAATIGTIAAWDVAFYTVEVTTQLDTDVAIDRSLSIHAGATLAVTALVGVVVYGAFLFGGWLPPFALLFLVVGAALVVIGLVPDSGE